MDATHWLHAAGQMRQARTCCPRASGPVFTRSAEASASAPRALIWLFCPTKTQSSVKTNPHASKKSHMSAALPECGVQGEFAKRAAVTS